MSLWNRSSSMADSAQGLELVLEKAVGD